MTATHGASAVGLVVPCFNEAGRLDTARIRQFVEATPGLALLLVDDGSTDGTPELLRGMAGTLPGVEVLRLPENRGKAEAVRQGLNDLIARGLPIVGFWDADLATPFEEFPAFRAILAKRPDIDWVFGARVKLLGRLVRRNELRHYLGRVFATAVSQTLHLPVYDTQCGAKLFRVNEDLRAVLAQPFLSRWIFEVEMLARWQDRVRSVGGRPVAERVYELPLMTWMDVKGSKVRPRDFVKAAWELFRIWRRAT